MSPHQGVSLFVIIALPSSFGVQLFAATFSYLTLFCPYSLLVYYSPGPYLLLFVVIFGRFLR